MSKKMHIKLNVNGKDEEFLAEPRELLIYTLRERLNITGPHIGCETSHCGACTVTINGKSVKSCTMCVAQADGAKVTTIEESFCGDEGSIMVNGIVYDVNNPKGSQMIPGGSVSGCDSIVEIELTFLPAGLNDIDIGVCDTDYSITINGTLCMERS